MKLEWINLALDGVPSQKLVNKIIEILFHNRRGICWPAERLMASEEVFPLVR
jgi:hypothetical protein